ncbi:MAG: hypothetical protein M5U12_10705 [Verrucomicrobia bacterium]|nr:hypothetical protein [Verrucomicrobiota bacterium]
MKSSDPLARLLRAAARDAGPAPVPATFALEERVVREWQSGAFGAASSLEGNGMLAMYRRGLAFACGCMVLALAMSWLQYRREHQPSPWTGPAAAVMLVYSR